MKRRRPVNRLRIALVGVLIIAVGVYFAFTKRVPFLHGYRFNANFASSNQLVPGFSPVRIAGVTVGKVTGVDNGPGDTTKVTMELKDSALPLHTDARVRIRPRLFLEGGFAVELSPGSPSAPGLEDGGTLPRAQTAIPVQLHQILTAFDHSTRADLQAFILELDKGLDKGGAKALGRSFRPLAPVLRDTAQIAEAARGVRPHDASVTIRSTARITSALATHERDLQGLVTALNVTTTALASRDVAVAGSVREFDNLVRSAPRQLNRIDRTLPAVRRFVTAVRPTLRALPPVLDHTVPVLDQLQGLVSGGELPRLVTALRPTVIGLGPLETRLDQLFSLVTPVTDCVREKAVPVLTTEVPDGALSTGRPAWQDLVHGLGGLAGATQDFDANGYSIRYQAGAGETVVGTGSLPGLGTLTGLAAGPITGSRPRYLGPGVTPPLRPDAPCADQAVADLSQRTAAGGGLPTVRHVKRKPPARVTLPQLRRLGLHYRRALKLVGR